MNILLLKAVLVGQACISALLTVGSVDAEPGQTGVALPVSLTASQGEEVSAIQFTVVFDSGTLDLPEVVLGPAAQAAGKEIQTNPVSAGKVQVLIAGLNQDAIADGVVASALFDVDAGAAPDSYVVMLESLSLSDPFGAPLDADALGGAIRLPGGEGEGTPHTADQNGDWDISLSELLRVIQFYNVGNFHCESGTEDGYAPGPGGMACEPHASDYAPQDWTIWLSELLRLIQFYNSGGYHECAQGEDGFCPGAG